MTRGRGSGATTDELAAEVAGARAAQAERFAAPRLNASIRPGELRKWCGIDAAAERLLETASASGALSARGVGRVLRVARTVADLGGSDDVTEANVLEALRWRVEPGT